LNPLNLTPEASVLFLTAGGPRTDPAIREAVTAGVDWPSLVSLARREQAEGILWHRLRGCVPGVVPPDIAADLEKLALVREFRQRRLEQGLREAVGILGAAGIDVLLVKGAALAHTVYDGFLERPMGDLDLVVAPGAAREAQALLLDAGWVPDRTTPLDYHYEEHQHLRPLRDPLGVGVWLELHRELLPRGAPFRMMPDLLWGESRSVPDLGPHVRAPTVHHHILYGCLHLAWAHRLTWGAWTTFRDLDAMLRPETDWERIVGEALDARAGTYCYWVFRLARGTAGVPIPDHVLGALRPRRADRILRLLEKHFAQGLLPQPGTCPSARLSTALWRSGMGAPRGGRHRTDAPSPFLREAPDRGVARVRGHLRRSAIWKRYLCALLE
jgi:hypothetical protein